MAGSSPACRETYLFLDFSNKIGEEVLQNNFFFRFANINSQNPLIQINDHLFRGKYTDCVGTNLFFEDDEETQPITVFDDENTIRLKHTITQFKTLSLTALKIPSNLKDIPEPEYDIQINQKYSYEELLKKLGNGSLNLESEIKIVPKGTKKKLVSDTKTKSNASETKDKQENKKISKVSIPEKSREAKISNIIKENEGNSKKADQVLDILTLKYDKLKKLARRPSRRKLEQELIADCDPKYKKSYDYNSIKCQMMKPSDYFPEISQEFNKDTLLGAVNIDRSILQGIIEPSTSYYRILTEKEKLDLLSMENLENLSYPARYWVLKSQLDHLESLLLTKSKKELSETDSYGRTIKDNIKIYKRLVRVINGIIKENYFYNSDAESENDDSDAQMES